MINISKKLSSKINLIPGCASQLLDQLHGLALTKEDLFKIKLCLEEALANAVVHGNHLRSELPVAISLRVKEEAVEIDVVNQGEGFDFRKLDDPRREEKRGKLHGRGLFLIKNNMDKIDFFDHGRGITMTKFFTQRGVGCGH
jgi:serine/threonine-protein kinase RsbW